jgi:hypothetical protein
MLNVMYQRLMKPAMFRIKDVHPNKPLRFLGHPKDSRDGAPFGSLNYSFIKIIIITITIIIEREMCIYIYT